MTSTRRPATIKEIRAEYVEAGMPVRISRDGKVTFKHKNAPHRSPWLNGLNVSDYVWCQEYGAHLKF